MARRLHHEDLGSARPPLFERAVDHALTCAARRIDAHDDELAVLVHGDVHEWNALQGDGEFELAIRTASWLRPSTTWAFSMREDPLELLQGDASARARWLAVRCGLDVAAIWEWGVVERVSTGLLCARIGLQPVGAQMLAVADQLAGWRFTSHAT